MSVVSTTAPVLIVGAGPGGLFAACELARHGVRARLVDRMTDPHHEARATALQPAVLELLARAGVVERFLATGVPVRGARMFGPGLKQIAVGTFAGIGSTYEHQCSLPQWMTEEILTAHLEQLGGRVERGTEVEAIEDSDDFVHVLLRHGNGSLEELRVSYLLGAGGAHGPTRATMHATLDGTTYRGHFVVADVRVDLPGEPEEARVCVGPTGLVLLAPLPDQRWIMFVTLDEDQATPLGMHADEATVAALVDGRLGAHAGIHDMRWSSTFAMHRRISPRLAEGRRFLLGDAAHLSSPLGGEGMNAAITDAADIAWKLALVLNGSGRPVLLNSYAVERGLADQHVLEVSDLVHSNVMSMVETYAAGREPVLDPPDAARDLVLQRSRTMLDVSYAGSPLVAERVADVSLPSAGQRFPYRDRLSGTRHHLLHFGDCSTAELARLGENWTGLVDVVDGRNAGFDATLSGADGGGALLVRPDGVIGFRTCPADKVGLAALDQHLNSYLVPRAVN